MELYIKRSNEEITLDEWKKYVASDRELDMKEVIEAINPITKEKLRMSIPGHTMYKLNGKEILGNFYYRNGLIESEQTEKEFVIKALKIAAYLNADLYVDDEKVN